MSKLLQVFCLSVLLVSFNGVSQIVLTGETFGAGSAQGTSANGFVGDMGTWTVANTGANGAFSNNWYVSGEECGMTAGNCGIACSGGNNSLHISAVGGLCGATPDCGAAYDATGAANITNQRAISPVFSTATRFYIELNFDYIAAQDDDGFWVEYSTDGGTTWFTFTGGNVAATQCCSCLDALVCAFFGLCCAPQTQLACTGLDQGFWTAANLSFPPAADDNMNVRFAFHWSNDGDGAGMDPSVAIDNIEITYATSLPVEMTSFEGDYYNDMNQLFWRTASESDVSHFAIQHSFDGINYSEVSRTNATNRSSGTAEYAAQHVSAAEENYYRIKTVDNDGAYEYSDAILIKRDLNSTSFSIINDQLIIKGLTDKKGTIQLFDQSGRLIKDAGAFDFSDEDKSIWVGDLKSGFYIISIESNHGEERLKLVW